MNDGVYEKLGQEVGRMVAVKVLAYGDSFNRAGDILKILYPQGVAPADYAAMLAIVRILDKLFRVANDPIAFGENPGNDIAGYGLLLSRLLDQKGDDLS